MTNPRRRMIGTVVGTSMTKTVVVRVDRTVRHPLYGKVVHRSQKFLAHDERGCQKGDRVQIVESKPVSRRKRWAVESILAHDRRIREVTAEGAESELQPAAKEKADAQPVAGGGE
ncbi:MAG: 30S ribosomal protein S17 [Anaerolineales bacterium]|nr:30S ribosomal protein S17 [Anaerolineales bacterium]